MGLHELPMHPSIWTLLTINLLLDSTAMPSLPTEIKL
jgi:hypothetical protein